MKWIIAGHILLVLCCLFYLFWWCVAFRPGYTGARVSGLPGILLLITAAAGLSGIVISVIGINGPTVRKGFVPTGYILIAGIIIYFGLLIITRLILHRQVTTELFLIVGWLAVELISFQTAYRMEGISVKSLLILCVLAFAAALVSLFFYLQYYQVNEARGYIYGMIPLITEALCMAIFLFLAKRGA
ncbi:MAG: hypothetical protein IKE31_04785 [Eubacterium sp.]|nr:hypothetical protein [Eubacterium sp.]